MTDILSDAQARIERRIKSQKSREQAIEVLSELRLDYAGERCYIAHNGEDVRRLISARDAAIRRAWAAGDRAAVLARQYGISRQRVYQIVSSALP